jgi:hypothetical protein
MAKPKSGTRVPKLVEAPEAALLTQEEGADLTRLEATVERGYAGFMEVGEALAEISRRRLYRATHATFDEYCRDRWKMGANYARKQIRAAEVVAALGQSTQMGTRVPISEKVARPLTAVKKPAERRKAWHRAVTAAQKAGREEPTPDDVKRAVANAGGLVLNGSGKIDKLASMRASREAQATKKEEPNGGESKRTGHLRAALDHLHEAAKADDDRWAAKIGAQADRVATLLGHVQTVDRR